MYQKLWLRGTALLALLLLLSTILSACWPFDPSPSTASTPTSAQSNCLGDLLSPNGSSDNGSSDNGSSGDDFLHFLQDSFKDDHIGEPDEHIVNNTKSTDSGIGSDCSQAIQDFVNQNSQQGALQLNLKPPTFQFGQQVGVHQLSDSTFPFTYDSQVLVNCTGNSAVSTTVSYSVPVMLAVGTLDANNQLQPQVTYGPLSADAAGISNGYIQFPRTESQFYTFSAAETIAKEVYSQPDFPDPYADNSKSFTLQLPANSIVRLHLPLTINYRTGWGEVESNGQTGQMLDWYYNYDFQPNFDPTNLTLQEMTVVTPCP